MSENFQWMNRKPIQEMTEDEKDQAIYSARYILEDYFEQLIHVKEQNFGVHRNRTCP